MQRAKNVIVCDPSAMTQVIAITGRSCRVKNAVTAADARKNRKAQQTEEPTLEDPSA
jgi:hypothetical protein